jgi:hypothetical protein
MRIFDADWATELATNGHKPVLYLAVHAGDDIIYWSDRAYVIDEAEEVIAAAVVVAWGSMTDAAGSPSTVWDQVVSSKQMSVQILNTAATGWLPRQLRAGQQVDVYLGWQYKGWGSQPPDPILLDTLYVHTPFSMSATQGYCDVTLRSILHTIGDQPVGIKAPQSDYWFPWMVGRAERIKPYPWGQHAMARLAIAANGGDGVLDLFGFGFGFFFPDHWPDVDLVGTVLFCDRDLLVAGFDPDGGTIIIDYETYQYIAIVPDRPSWFFLARKTPVTHLKGSWIIIPDHAYQWGVTTNYGTDVGVIKEVCVGDRSYLFHSLNAIPGVAPGRIEFNSWAHFGWNSHPLPQEEVTSVTEVNATVPAGELVIDGGLGGRSLTIDNGEIALTADAWAPWASWILTALATARISYQRPPRTGSVSGKITFRFELYRDGLDVVGRAEITNAGGSGNIFTPPVGVNGWTEFEIERDVTDWSQLTPGILQSQILYRATSPAVPEGDSLPIVRHISMTADITYDVTDPGFPRIEYLFDDMYMHHNPGYGLPHNAVYEITNWHGHDWWQIPGVGVYPSDYRLIGLIDGKTTILGAIAMIARQGMAGVRSDGGKLRMYLLATPASPSQATVTPSDYKADGLTYNDSGPDDVYNSITIFYGRDELRSEYTASLSVYDAVSIARYGERPLQINADLIQSEATALQYANFLLALAKDGTQLLTVTGYLPALAYEQGDVITAEASWAGINQHRGMVVRTTYTPGRPGEPSRVQYILRRAMD